MECRTCTCYVSRISSISSHTEFQAENLSSSSFPVLHPHSELYQTHIIIPTPSIRPISSPFPVSDMHIISIPCSIEPVSSPFPVSDPYHPHSQYQSKLMYHEYIIHNSVSKYTDIVPKVPTHTGEHLYYIHSMQVHVNLLTTVHRAASAG